jgi:hypothetical protein
MNSCRIVPMLGAALAVLAGPAVAERITIVSEADAARIWAPATGVARVVAGYPDAAGDKSQDVCVNIGFLINKDGSTSDFTELKAWSSRSPDADARPEGVQPFVQSAAAAVSLWRFEPVKGKPRSIYTSASFGFAGSRSLPTEQVRAHCAIDDLPGFVARASDKSDRRRDRLEREQLQDSRR